MASFWLCPLLHFLFISILCISFQVKCDDEAHVLLQGINDYRKSLNLTTLTKIDNAECLAEKIAEQFKNQPCTNTTGSNTVPGTEPQFSDFPTLLDKCHLNVSDTRDGSIMPACVPNLDPSLVLNNFTETQYSGSLNDTKYTGAGIGSDGNWIVAVLTTSTPQGSFGSQNNAQNAARLTAEISLIFSFLCLLVGAMFLL